MAARTLLLLLGLVAAGCISTRGGYVRIAEGLSSPTRSEGILAAPRMTGPFRIRVRALCGLDPAFTFVTGTVTQ